MVTEIDGERNGKNLNRQRKRDIDRNLNKRNEK